MDLLGNQLPKISSTKIRNVTNLFTIAGSILYSRALAFLLWHHMPLILRLMMRESTLFKKYSNSKKLSKYKDWIRWGTDERFSLLWYKGLKSAFLSPNNAKLKEPCRLVVLTFQRHWARVNIKWLSDAALKCKDDVLIRRLISEN